MGGDPAAGIAVLDTLEDRGRDLRSFADQVVEALRTALHDALAGRATGDPLAALGAPALAAAARRLAAVDPARPGPGGLRLALELVLFDVPPVTSTRIPAGTAAQVAAPGPAPRATPKGPDSATGRGSSALAEGTPRAAAAPGAPGPSPAGHDVPVPGRAAPPLPETVASPAEGPAAADALDELRRRWPEIVALVSRHPPTRPLIEACRPIAVDGAIVTLGFPESQLFLRDVADRRRGTLEDGLGRVLGRPVSVRCVATNLDLEPALPGDPEGTAVLRAAREVWGDDLLEIPEVG